MIRFCLCSVAIVLAAHGAGLKIVHEPIPGVPIVGPVRVENSVAGSGLSVRSEVLDLEPAQRVLPGPRKQSQTSFRVNERGTDAWVIIKSEDFEGAFPNEWTLYGDPTWDDENYRAHGGSWSGYCVGSTVSPPGPYPPDARSWMVYGPFSLSGALDAKADFYRWMDVEDGYDYFYWGASIDGQYFYGYADTSSNTSWQFESFDLKNVPTLGNLCGQSQVWIGFLFESDYSNEEEGVYIDDIVLQKNTSGGSGPDLTFYQPAGWDFPIVPSNVSGTHTVPSPLPPGTNYIDWAGRNVGDAATADTFWIYLYLDNVPLAGWYAVPPVNPGVFYYVDDYQTSISGGNHTLMTFQDSTDRIDESNEGNNRYSHTWNWGGGGSGDYEHVTITTSALRSHFAPLSDFIEASLGLNDTVVVLSDIYASCPGRDNQEKIRNFIKDAYADWSTTHVLLGGDADVVPCRLAYGRVNSQTEYIPCDLYYSDLDGTWDGDGDNIFGEPTDGVDMYPDVYVGRVPASNATSVDRFVSRTTSYGGNSSAPYLENVLLGGFDLDGSTFCETTMEFYDVTYVPAAMRPCNKVYDSHTGNHKTNILSFLNAGQHIWIHADHGDASSLGCGTVNHGWELSNSDISGLSNGTDYSILLSMACLIGAFDESDCFTEYLMNASGGGGVAAMTNSRYGWYNPGLNPQRTLSALMVERVVASLFNLPGHGSLEDFAFGKATLVPEAASEMVYRWCMYTFNLFGEPALNVWIPGQSAVTEPELPGIPGRALTLTAPSHFKSSVALNLELPAAVRAGLTVYDGSGRAIRTIRQALMRAGRHTLRWDGKNESGCPAPAGIYYVRLQTERGQASCKLVKLGEE